MYRSNYNYLAMVASHSYTSGNSIQLRDNSRVASRKTYFHLRLSIQYVKFLWKGIKNNAAVKLVNTNFQHYENGNCWFIGCER